MVSRTGHPPTRAREEFRTGYPQQRDFVTLVIELQALENSKGRDRPSPNLAERRSFLNRTHLTQKSLPGSLTARERLLLTHGGETRSRPHNLANVVSICLSF